MNNTGCKNPKQKNKDLLSKIQKYKNEIQNCATIVKTLTSEIIELKNNNNCLTGHRSKSPIQINVSKTERNFNLICLFSHYLHYTCNVKDLRIINENSKIENIIGTHINLQSDSNVTRLKIENSNMFYLPINIFKKFQNLVAIQFKNTNLEHLFKGNFIGASKLKELIINGNKIKSLDDNIFEGTQGLESINLNSNKIEKLSPNTFERLENLKHLLMMNNLIEELHVQLFKDLVKLEHLDVSSNQLKSLDGKLLIFNTKLAKIYFNKNKIQVIGGDILNYSKKINVFDFYGNVCISKVNNFDDFVSKIIQNCRKR